jgi:transcriptional regulator with XRE-family HTH domain
MNDLNGRLDSPRQLLAKRLRTWRLQKDIPLKELAAALGISISLASAWEHGKRFPSGLQLMALAEYTGQPICRFLYPDDGHCPVHSKRPSA